MAQKRMFDKTITNSDEFLDLPDSSQVLYFHLSMNADDDGFVNNWKSIIRMTGTKEDDLKILIAKSFVIPFESGVIVIKHWRINNFLRKDRHTETKFQKELSMLEINDNQEYVWLTNVQPSIDKNRIDKISIDKNRIDKNNNKNILNNEINIYCRVIDYLNEKTNSNYKSTTTKTQRLINAREKEGFEFEDFKTVIDKKCNDWLGTDMEKFLRPETLFGPKFESYLNQPTKKRTLKDIKISEIEGVINK